MLWREFPTQAALRTAIRERVNPKPFDTPFADSLISDLIAERHYFCSLRGLRPASFKKTRENDPYRFWGLFDHGWHPVSWDSCVSGPPGKRAIIVRALRDRVDGMQDDVPTDESTVEKIFHYTGGNFRRLVGFAELLIRESKNHVLRTPAINRVLSVVKPEKIMPPQQMNLPLTDGTNEST